MAELDETWEFVQSEATEIIRHALVRQLLSAKQRHATAPFTIEGQRFKRFILVGNLFNFQNGPSVQSFNVTDGTGSIKASIWHDNIGGNKIADTRNFPYFSMPYVRIAGELEAYRGQTAIRVHSIAPISDPHEPYHHILQSIHDTIVYERGRPPKPATTQQSVASPVDMTFDGPSMYSPPVSPFKQVNIRRGSSSASSSRQIIPNGSSTDNDQAENQREPGRESHYTPSRPTHRAPTNGAPDLPPANSDKRKQSISNINTRATSGNKTSNHNDVRSMSAPSPGQITTTPKTPPRRRSNPQGSPLSPISPRSNSQGSPLSPISPRTPSSRQATPRRDPYSHLSSLQRDILLCIKNAQADYERAHHTTDGWTGVYLPIIVQAAKTGRPNIELEDLMTSIDVLFEKDYIFNIMDDRHYGCH